MDQHRFLVNMIKKGMYILVILFLISALQLQAAESDPKSPVGFIKGFCWGYPGMRGEYLGIEPDRSLKLLAETGNVWNTICFAGHMETHSSTDIQFGDSNERMVTDEEIRRAIRLSRKHGMKILMLPCVNPRDGVWRGRITFDTDEEWETWWGNYEKFIVHYARIASEEKCEMYSVGCEQPSSEHMEKHWRRLIAKVREVYNGPLTYNTNWGDTDKIKWWNALDMIAISAFYPVATVDDTSLETMIASWEPVRNNLRRICRERNMTALFIQVGMRSARTCSTMPWDWEHRDLPYDAEEQARYYEAAFRSFWNEPWFAGYAWWDWKSRLHKLEDAGTNLDFGIYGKPAAKVLKEWYSKPR